MTIHLRNYGPGDFERVSNFLVDHFQPENRDGNWLQPAWEYMHSHPYLDQSLLDRIGIWETDGVIVGVVNFEFQLGQAFFQIAPDHRELKPAMLAYAEEHLVGTSEEGERYLLAYVNDFDHELEELVKASGFELAAEYSRPMSMFEIPNPFPEIELPAGYRLMTLAEDNDLRKVHRVLWRGFGHEGEPPEEGIADRQQMQSTPNYRKDLTVVVEAPSGDFASFCGMWYERVNGIAYVEPVATDPEYRRMGLGKACVLDGIRRCGEVGAASAFVATDRKFYRSIGFKKQYVKNAWLKKF